MRFKAVKREELNVRSKSICSTPEKAEILLKIIKGVILFCLVFTFYVSRFTGDSHAAVTDRVIAFVDDQAITLSELEENYKTAGSLTPDITRREVLNTMINRMILLKEAKKYRIEAPTIEEVMKEYIDLKIRAFIRVNDADIEKFYKANMQNFKGKEYEDVRDEIDMYLTEKTVNERLKETLSDLRKKAYIRIYLNEE